MLRTVTSSVPRFGLLLLVAGVVLLFVGRLAEVNNDLTDIAAIATIVAGAVAISIATETDQQG